MKRVIITGANGFIGSSLIKELIKKKIEMIAIDRLFISSNLPKSNLITKIEMELDDIDSVLSAIPTGEYDVFYHFAWAGVNGADKADPLIQVKNVEMTLSCAKMAKKLKVNKFLCAGTIAERSSESLSSLKTTSGGMLYGIAKHATHLMLETYCKNINLNFVWMQFSNIYGPSNKTGNLVSYTIETLNSGKEAFFGPANQPYDFIYVDDLVEAVMRLGENITTKHYYFIGSGEPKLLKEYLFEIGEQCGKKDLIKIGMRSDDGIKYSIEMFDISSLKKDIGNYTSRSFAEGIKYTLENYLK